jgi:hypothetical protein
MEGMVESRDELIAEITKEILLGHMGEEAEDEDEDKGDDGGDTAAPPAPMSPVAAAPEEVVEEEDPVEMVPEQEALWRMKSSWQMLGPISYSPVSTTHS